MNCDVIWLFKLGCLPRILGHPGCEARVNSSVKIRVLEDPRGQGCMRQLQKIT